MTVTFPLALLLLALIPMAFYIGWPRNRFRRVRDSYSLFLRTLMILLLVLALAGTRIVQSSDRLAVVFLVDVSDSVGTAAQEIALDYIRNALPDMQPDDLAGIVAFGGDAQVARSMNVTKELGPIRVVPYSGNTNLAAAIRLGLALFPDDVARRLVVLSDGQPTIGDTQSAAQLAAAAGVEISYVGLKPQKAPDIQVRDVHVPAVVDEGQEFDLSVTIVAEQRTQAIVTVSTMGDIVNRQEVDLQEGTNTYSLRLRGSSVGFRDFNVRVDPIGDDAFYQNNSLGAFSRVEGAPRVLVVVDQPEEAQHIVPALQSAGLAVDLIVAPDLPQSVESIASYESVVLVNVSAVNLSIRQMEVIESYVRDLGGGLVVVGGPNTYAPGGYFKTPLEDVLPVEMQIKDQQRMPQLTIAYVIDRSGSMGVSGSGGVSNLELAQSAIIRSVEFLQQTDRAAIATFDSSAYWVVPFQSVDNKNEFQRLVATMRPGGGTSIMAGYRLVSQSITTEESELKHVIILTDGGANPAGLVDMAAGLYQDDNVTTSVISIGQFEANFLEQMARAGGGNYHQVVNPANIPTIFTLEAVFASRSYIAETTFVPTLTAAHPIMQSIQSIPTLEGYVAVTPRAAAQVILRGPEPFNDPILTAWQYGLGRSVAFTSDATGRWASNWVTWGDFSSFWSQAVRWTITEGASSNLETQVIMEDEQARIVIDARDNDGSFLNGLDLQTNVIYSGDQAIQRVQLRQVAPGRYEGVFIPDQEGTYLLRVNALSDAQDIALSQTTGWVMGYSPEYEIRETDDDDVVLETVAEITGGRDLSVQPELVFQHDIDAQNSSVPIWPWLLILAIGLLPFDIAVRRLLITKTDLNRLRVWALRYREREEETSVGHLSSLKMARDRARQRTAADGERESTIGALRSRMQQGRSDEQPLQPIEPKQSKPKFEARKPQPQPDEANIGARLLKRRKRDEESE